MSTQMKNEFTVLGMTCGHCVMSVSEEVSEIPGVTDVRVDLPTGRLEVMSTAAITRDSVKEAVEEAGYKLGEEA